MHLNCILLIVAEDFFHEGVSRRYGKCVDHGVSYHLTNRDDLHLLRPFENVTLDVRFDDEPETVYDDAHVFRTTPTSLRAESSAPKPFQDLDNRVRLNGVTRRQPGARVRPPQCGVTARLCSRGRGDGV